MNKTIRPVNWAMLRSYAEGRLDEHQQQELQQWLQEHTTHKLILDEVVAIYENDRRLDATERYKHYKTEPALHRFMQQLSLEKTPAKKIWNFFRISAVAAGILCLLGISYFFFNRNISTALQDNKAVAGLNWQKVSSGTGHILRITLADGSSVRLAPGSTLQYPQSFGSKERLVRLEGEAFFEVTKDPAHPFIVQTHKLSTRVLGTSFNIEAYGSQLFSKVTLITGKIAVGRIEDIGSDTVLAILVPNESITVSNDDSTFSIAKIRQDNATAIKDGKLVFESATMKEVANKLELYYGIKVHLDAATESVLFTGTFEHIALKTLVGMIAETTGLRMEQVGDDLYIGNPKTK